MRASAPLHPPLQARLQPWLERMLAFALVLGLGWALFLPVPVGKSVVPGLRAGQWVLVSRWAYWLTAPQRGDLVALTSQHNAADEGIQLWRVIGLPNEEINLTGIGLTVDGRLLQDAETAPSLLATPSSRESERYVLREDEYLVVQGTALTPAPTALQRVRRSEILGRAWIVFFPLENIALVAPSRPTLITP